MSIKHKRNWGQRSRVTVKPERLEKQLVCAGEPGRLNLIAGFVDDDLLADHDPFEGIEFEDVYLEPIPVEKQRS